jgi:DNA replication protein DnaC
MRQILSSKSGIPNWRPLFPEFAMPECTRCQGTGWILLDGTNTPIARRCECSLLSRVLKLKDRVGIPQGYEHCTLDIFLPANLSQVRAALAARRFAERFPATSRGLLFSGDSGIGKTHLAVGIIRELACRSRGDFLFLNFGDLMEGLPSGSSWDRAKAASVLVIDDLGSGTHDSTAFSHMQELLEVRVRECKPLVLTAGRVRLRNLCSGKPGEEMTPAEAFFRRLTPSLLFSLLGQLRKFLITGHDLRGNLRSAPLF